MMTQVKKFAKSNLEQYLRGEYLNTPILNQSPENPSPKREPIKHLLIGSPKVVTSTIHFLQVIGYANVKDWSPLLPTSDPDEVFSILSRHILIP
ncbi:hypothetical protein VB735_10570 [Halotia wernerae UHCC 0503]|nr:hypothetical protein [Halotia wernerae UHCC 0503]